MKDLTTFDSILDFAIDEEQKAVEFYTELAGQASSDEMRQVFEEFAQEFPEASLTTGTGLAASRSRLRLSGFLIPSVSLAAAVAKL